MGWVTFCAMLSQTHLVALLSNIHFLNRAEAAAEEKFH
jgi:hypothetical protein